MRLRAAVQRAPELWFEAVRAMEYHVTALWESGEQEAAIRLMEDAEWIERGRERAKTVSTVLEVGLHRGRFGAGRISATQSGMEPALKVKLLKTIAEGKPAAYSALADSLEELSQEHAIEGELELVLECVSEAVKIRRKLVASSLKLHGLKLFHGLRSMYSTLRALKRNAEAERVSSEIEVLRTQLRQAGVDAGPEPHAR
jgi:hypothetical protein